MLKLEAKIASAEGKSKESADVLEKILAEDPLDGDALLLLGQHYAKNKSVEIPREADPNCSRDPITANCSVH